MTSPSRPRTRRPARAPSPVPPPPGPGGRPLGQLVLVAVLTGVLAAVLGWAGLAPAWAVLVGAAAALGGPAASAGRGLALTAGAAAGWAAGYARAGIGEDVATATGVVVAGLVLVAVLVARYAPVRVPVWPVLLGAAALLVAFDTGAPGAATGVAVLAGLAGGILAVLAAEVATAWQRRPRRTDESESAPAERDRDGEQRDPGTEGAER